MKRYLCIIFILLLTFSIFAGCNSSTDSEDNDDQAIKVNEEDENISDDKTEHNMWLIQYPPPVLRPDNIVPDSTITYAIYKILEEGEKIVVNEDGNFSLEYSGSIHEDEKVRVTVNKLTITGRIDDTDSILNSVEGDIVGKGHILTELHYFYHRWDPNTNETNPEDRYINIDCDLNILAWPIIINDLEIESIFLKPDGSPTQKEHGTIYLADGTTKDFVQDNSNVGLMLGFSLERDTD